MARYTCPHDVIRLVRFSPEDVEHAAVNLAAVASRHQLESVIPHCREAVRHARAAVALAAHHEVQKAALNRKPKRLRPYIPRAERITASTVAAAVKLAREDLYLALFLGLVGARRMPLQVDAELWDAFRQTTSTRLDRAHLEQRALDASPPLPVGPNADVAPLLPDQRDGRPAVWLRTLRSWWLPVAEGPLAALGPPASWPVRDPVGEPAPAGIPTDHPEPR